MLTSIPFFSDTLPKATPWPDELKSIKVKAVGTSISHTVVLKKSATSSLITYELSPEITGADLYA